MDIEEWRDVVDWPEYSISNFGRVWSKRSQKFLVGGLAERYYIFIACVNNKRKALAIHREVMRAFCGQPAEGMQVAHLDGDRFNNNLSNLQYVSAKENQRHRFIHGTHNRGANCKYAKLDEEVVQEIRDKYIPFKYGAPTLALEYNIGESQIYRIIKGETWK